MKRALLAVALAGCFDWSQFADLPRDGAIPDDASIPDGGAADAAPSDLAPIDWDALGPVDLAGRVWQLVMPSPAASATFVSLTGTTDGTHSVYAAATQTLAGSVSGGSWTALGPSSTSYTGVAVDNGDQVWTVSGGLAQYAIDPSVPSWTGMPINESQGSYYAIFSAGSSLFVAGASSGSGRIWSCTGPSCTAGSDWGHVDPPELALGHALWGSWAGDLFVAGDGSGGGVIMHSISLGASWTPEMTGGPPFKSLWGGGGRVYAVASDGSFWVRAGQPTWTQGGVPVPLTKSLYGVWSSADGRVVIAVGQASSGHSLILESGDGGVNFNPTSKGGTSDILYTVWGDGSNAWVAGTGGAIYRMSL